MYTKRICKMSDLGKDVQVFVEKGATLIAQYICHEGKCTCTLNTTGQLTEQSGYLVLTMQNISQIDQFDALKWDKSGKKTLLKGFTLNEVLPTSAAPDLTDEDVTLKPSITRTEPLIMTNTAKVFIGVGAVVAVVALAVAFYRRRRCGPPPHQQHAR
ncbi:hypothetical protein G5714_022272 [Onychostoma macrolepis]|uniref:Uncharacterized protein n=1 Tax=Onychostoma macrolepis TaxID=369639 RepID=A0A7J6BPG6_9TELE|nr:hypothetical protein G5714_022272 [Onychostoma macrolepis]